MIQSKLEKTYLLSVCLLAFFLPMLNNMQSVSIMAIGLAWLLSGQYRTLLSRLRQNNYVWLWVLFFLLHALSLLYSENMEEGIGELSRKASFLILPLIIGGAAQYSAADLDRIFGSFISGLCFTALWCFYNAYAHYPEQGIGAFFYDSLSSPLDNNAVYTSWKCYLGLIIILFHPFRGYNEVLRFVFQICAFALLFFFIILLSSKTIILAVLLVTVFRGIYLLVTDRKRWLRNLFLIGSSLLITYSLFTVDKSPLKKRYMDITSAVHISDSNEAADIAIADNYSKRIVMWQAAWENIRTGHTWLTGCGIGDVKDVQNAKLAHPGFHFRNFVNIASLRDLNIHNAYLQTFLGIGITGVIVLLLIVFVPLYHGFRSLNYVCILFMLLSIAFLAQESAFQVQAGIVYLSFFTCVLANRYNYKVLPVKNLRDQNR